MTKPWYFPARTSQNVSSDPVTPEHTVESPSGPFSDNASIAIKQGAICANIGRNVVGERGQSGDEDQIHGDVGERT